jgi:hypothetical protein
MRLSLDLPYVPGSVVRASMEPSEKVAKVYMVNAGRMLSGGH